MPIVLWALVIVLVMQVVLDIASLAESWSHTSSLQVWIEFAALAVDASILTLLLRGSETTRVFLRLAAGLGMVVDGALLLSTLVWAPSGVEGMVAIGTAAALLSFSVFAYWALGRESVSQWMFTRWLARVD